MAIKEEKIEAVRRRIDILQVIGSAVALKKSGQRYMGCCPFHSEKSPSFSVSPERGLYYCFGCHAGGDVFSFVMRHDGLDFGQALRKLAAQAGVELEPEPPELQARRKAEAELAHVNDYALAFFEHTLGTAAGSRARAYLSERGVVSEQVRQWRLGYGGTGSELADYLEAKKVPAELAERAGLLSAEGRRGLFDGRLIFPIMDAAGRVAGFGGRRLVEEHGPKYVNSRESALFSKRRLLYGWQQAEAAVRKQKRVVLVEGYMDVLACHRAGVCEAVAALGTAFTKEHAATVGRLAKEALLLFDGDDPGQAASREAAERLLTSHLKTLVVPLPAGDDPDSLVRQGGPRALAERLDHARPAVEHFIDRALGHANMSIEDRAEAASSLASLISALGTGLERDLYTAKLAERVGVSTEQLQQHLRRATRTAQRRARPGRATAEQPAADAIREEPAIPQRRELLALRELLLYPALRPRFGELAEYATDPMRILLESLAASDAPLAEALPPVLADAGWVRRLCQAQPASDDTPEEAAANAERTFDDVLRRFKARHIDAQRAELTQQLREMESRGEDTEELTRRIQSLIRAKRQLGGSRTSA